jgi:sec-independent protein translocase protein TatC
MNTLNDLPLAEHLAELRKRLLACVVVVLVSFGIIMCFYIEPVMNFFVEPVKKLGINLVYIGLGDVVIVQVKAALLCALILTAPFLLWHIWQFVKPALYEKERKHIFLLATIILLLFAAGVVFGYYMVFWAAVNFFVMIGQGLAQPMLSIDSYMDFLLGFVLPFGLVFELPVLCYVLGRLGLINYHTLTTYRKHVILGIFIVAAFLTPPDVLSQVLMAMPMLVLYEVGILVLRFAGPKVENAKEN